MVLPVTGSPPANRGLRAVTEEEFSLSDAVGGRRGAVEALLPGFVFVVVFVLTRSLSSALGAAMLLAGVSVAMRVLERAPISQALSGMFGIAVGVMGLANRGGAGLFAFGLWQNAAYLAVTLISILVGWPVVGVVVELMKRSFSLSRGEDTAVAEDSVALASPPTGSGSGRKPTAWNSGATEMAAAPALGSAALLPALTPETESGNPFTGTMAWRRDPTAKHRYTLATWLWVGLFAVRLGVQLPLFLRGSVGLLGTARLLLGMPLWALVLYLTWAILQRGQRAAVPEQSSTGN